MPDTSAQPVNPIRLETRPGAECLVPIASRAIDDLTSALGMEPPELDLILELGEASSVVGNRVIIQWDPPRGRMQPAHWHELVVRHELTHVLLEQVWGMAPALFWEGLPIHLGDDHVRSRLSGTSYADWCAALHELDRLVALDDLLLPSVYYARRTDPRIDLIAGAFCGWLLAADRDVLERLYRTWEPPAATRPILSRAALDRALGTELGALEVEWKASLPEPDPSRVDRCREWSTPPPRRPHCDLCMTPVPNGTCPGCGFEGRVQRV